MFVLARVKVRATKTHNNTNAVGGGREEAGGEKPCVVG